MTMCCARAADFYMSGERTALCTLLMRQSVACPSTASLENIDPRYVCFHIYLLLPE